MKQKNDQIYRDDVAVQYSFSEWILYVTDPHIAELGSIQDWANVYPLIHWSLLPWGFYLILTVAFGFMSHVSKRNQQKYAEPDHWPWA